MEQETPSTHVLTLFESKYIILSKNPVANDFSILTVAGIHVTTTSDHFLLCVYEHRLYSLVLAFLRIVCDSLHWFISEIFSSVL